jgi:redox-sensitive bicupin YhaK (pirin superfamily)
MTAGRGIIHSEMPRTTDGMLHGFQLWINLPKKDKMCKPRYQDYQVGEGGRGPPALHVCSGGEERNGCRTARPHQLGLTDSFPLPPCFHPLFVSIRQAKDIPIAEKDGASVRVMAGESLNVTGPIKTRNPSLLLDCRLSKHAAAFRQPVPEDFSGFV